jgi:DNA-directed RNA polymerase specialized sigma24 family protein
MRYSHHDGSSHESYEREERAQTLRTAIGKLPVKYRLMIKVFDLNETGLSESYSALCISTSVPKTRLFRARRRLNLLLI